MLPCPAGAPQEQAGRCQVMPSHPLLSQQPFAALTSHPLPKTGKKKKITLPRGCPLGQRMSSQIQRETRKTLQEPKKQKKPQNPKPQIPGICARAQPALASAQLSSPPARPQLWGRAEVDNANQAGATPKMLRHPKPPPPTPGCFCCLLSSKEKEKQGWAGQYSPQRRELLSSGTEPRCAVGINTSEPQEPQRRIRSKQRP